jgi:hypothetical protein
MSWTEVRAQYKGSGLSMKQLSSIYKDNTRFKAVVTPIMRLKCRASANDLYKLLLTSGVQAQVSESSFVNGTFVQTGDKYTISLHCHHQSPHPTSIVWKDISCTAVSTDIKASPCTIGHTRKVFYRRAKDLKDYISKLHTGEITLAQHRELFAVVEKVIGPKFVNHNLDVNTLHFKYL